MAKAVANATTAAFITMVGSEFVQKYLGEGPRMVRDVFRLARENSPAIIFIDEIGEYSAMLCLYHDVALRS
jgi:26S proteasome regulatory subunit T3